MTDTSVPSLPNAWYKALTAIAGAVLVAAVATQQNNITIIALGASVVGVGEWINHPRRVEFRPGMKITTSSRMNTLPGSIIDVLGAAIIIFGVGRLLGKW